MKRHSEITKEKQFRFDQQYSKKYKSPLIKWFQTTLTPEEKFKLGLMTYPEYEAWQKQLAEEAASVAAAVAESTLNGQASIDGLLSGCDTPADGSHNDTDVVPDASPASGGATFWADDTSSRETISTVAYDDFLAQNNVSVGNAATVDVDALLAEHGDPVTPAEPDIDEILANVNRDLHGGSTVLSEDEIAAMFEAANSNK